VVNIRIEDARSLNSYIQAWSECMSHIHWFPEQKLMDWSREEEIEEIQCDFGERDNRFLIANDKDGATIGVLGFLHSGDIGVLRGWEPGVQPDRNDIDVGAALLHECFNILQEKGAERVGCTLKFPSDNPNAASWHIRLFNKCGIGEWRSKGIQLLLDLRIESSSPHLDRDVRIVDRSEFSIEELAELVQGAFTSTEEDRAIHRFDAGVTEPREIRQLLERILDGQYGISPAEAWKFALMEGEPVAFVGSFIPDSKYRPPHGVLGPVGVLPGVRRKGVATALIHEVHQVLRELGCVYSYVGTPETNHGALKMYKKIGFMPVFKVASFRKIF
jgi:GNAT superfamily N-acetyltransferase